MSIINNSYGFIFVHVPKAAGTSVTAALSGLTNYCDLEIGGTNFGERIQPAYGERFGILKHSTASELRQVVGSILWSKYFTFSFVRNPYTRCLSTFYFLKKWEGGNRQLREKLQSYQSFSEYVLSDVWETTNGPDQIFLPQAYWLRERPNRDKILIQKIGKLENLETDLRDILKIIDAPKRLTENLKVSQLNKSREEAYETLTNAAVIEKINKKYAVDFETFEYSENPDLMNGS